MPAEEIKNKNNAVAANTTKLPPFLFPDHNSSNIIILPRNYTILRLLQHLSPNAVAPDKSTAGESEKTEVGSIFKHFSSHLQVNAPT